MTAALRANAAPSACSEPRGFVVVLPAFSANARLKPALRRSRMGKQYPVLVPTDEYEAWKREAGQELMVQRPNAVSGPVAVSIVFVPQRTSADMDNVVKAPLDLLVEHGKLDGDTVKTVRELHVDVWDLDRWGAYKHTKLPIPKGHVQVRVRGLPAAAE